MTAKKELIAYCGLYCGDCLGYTGVIADAAQSFQDVLNTYRFDRTARFVFPEELSDYDKLTEMVSFMSGLRCAGICRTGHEGSEPSDCVVRDCCLERGFYACYECDVFESCPKLVSLLQGLHLESSLQNMRSIRAMGLQAWLAAGRRHTYWTEEDDGG
jgi:hypothetical protein